MTREKWNEIFAKEFNNANIQINAKFGYNFDDINPSNYEEFKSLMLAPFKIMDEATEV